MNPLKSQTDFRGDYSITKNNTERFSLVLYLYAVAGPHTVQLKGAFL